MSILKRIVVVVFGAGMGFIAGIIIVTPVMVAMNYVANDGPIFPPMLVALLVVVPVSIVIFIAQVILVLFELMTKRTLKNSLLMIGVASGGLAGLALYGIFYSSQSTTAQLLAFMAYGSIHGLVVLGIHRLAVFFKLM